jgi:hypothetical protein
MCKERTPSLVLNFAQGMVFFAYMISLGACVAAVSGSSRLCFLIAGAYIADDCPVISY